MLKSRENLKHFIDLLSQTPHDFVKLPVIELIEMRSKPVFDADEPVTILALPQMKVHHSVMSICCALNTLKGKDIHFVVMDSLVDEVRKHNVIESLNHKFESAKQSLMNFEIPEVNNHNNPVPVKCKFGIPRHFKRNGKPKFN